MESTVFHEWNGMNIDKILSLTSSFPTYGKEEGGEGGRGRRREGEKEGGDTSTSDNQNSFVRIVLERFHAQLLFNTFPRCDASQGDCCCLKINN